ncbi:MAG: hypothetical protein ACKPEQ_07345, partial [Dolichospermum sp.]
FLALATRLNTSAQKVEITPTPELNPQKVNSIQTAILSVDVSQGNTTASQGEINCGGYVVIQKQ